MYVGPTTLCSVKQSSIKRTAIPDLSTRGCAVQIRVTGLVLHRQMSCAFVQARRCNTVKHRLLFMQSHCGRKYYSLQGQPRTEKIKVCRFEETATVKGSCLIANEIASASKYSEFVKTCMRESDEKVCGR